jgi:uncharacterized protein YkwD
MFSGDLLINWQRARVLRTTLLKSIRKLGIDSDLISLTVLLLLMLSCGGGNAGLTGPDFPTDAQVEADSLALINQDRREHGQQELILDEKLTAIARTHSADMRDRDYLSHVTPDGKTLADRLKSGGISFRLAGENIERTMNISDPAGFANTSFLNDMDHRNNLLNNQFMRVGVGVAHSGSTYWITQDFVKP